MNGSNEPVNPTNNIQLYYRSQMSQQDKQEEKNLRNIVNNFISPSHDKSLTIAIYYKNTKLRQLFIKNNLHQDTIKQKPRCINILAAWMGVIPPKYILDIQLLP